MRLANAIVCSQRESMHTATQLGNTYRELFGVAKLISFVRLSVTEEKD